MAFPEMLGRVIFVRNDISEECNTSIIRVIRIGELGKTLAVTNNRRTQRLRRLLVTASVVASSPCHPDEGGAKFLRYVGSYKSHAV
jgi:hypothetical protein